MNKIVKFILIVLFITSIVLCIKINLDNKGNEKYGYWVKDSDYLYDIAINYLKEKKYNSYYDKDKEDYQVFFDYERFGIKEKDNKKYAYMYISEESYYVKHGKLRSDKKELSPYKFVFENNEVVNYEVPKLGSDFAPSVKEMFPNDIENKVLNYNFNSIKISKDVDNHYSYLGSTFVVNVDYDEDIIAICGYYYNDKDKSEINTINGQFMDGYGDIYEYTIPYDKNQELLIDIDHIDRNIISKYQGNKISTVSNDDLHKIKYNLHSIKEKYITTETTTQNNKLGFVKVLYKANNENMVVLDYNDNTLIDLIIHNSNLKKENISEAGKDILNILAKYNLSI